MTTYKTMLDRGSRLISELKISDNEICQVNVGYRGITIQLSAVELARVSKKLDVKSRT